MITSRRLDAPGDRPQILEEARGTDFLERSCLVPRDLACFAGHFPGAPVVPGVLQLDWAMDGIAVLLGKTPGITRIESLKFLAPLKPGARCRLEVRIGRDGVVDFRIWNEGSEHAKGRLRLEAARGRRP